MIHVPQHQHNLFISWLCQSGHHQLLTYFGRKQAQPPTAQQLCWDSLLLGLEGDISLHGTVSSDKEFIFVFFFSLSGKLIEGGKEDSI